MQRLKTRVINPYTISVVALGFLVMVISYLNCTNLISDLQFNVNAPDIIGGAINGEYIKQRLIAGDLNISEWIHEGMQFFILICGVLPSLAVLRFFDEKESIGKYTYARVKSYKASMAKTFLFYSFLAGVVTALPYYLFYLLNLVIGNQSLENSRLLNCGEAPHMIFSDLFGYNVVQENQTLFYGLLGITVFLFGMAYGFLALCSSLILDKKYQVVLVNFSLVVIVGLLLINFGLNQLSPFYTIMAFSGSDASPDTFRYFIPLIFPILLGVIFLISNKKVRAGF